MNGRVYDPQVGRFTSADPYIQAPYNSQSYNRYSYVLNNPVNFTDPSGYWSLGESYNNFKHWGQDHRDEIKQGVAIAAAVVTTALTAGAAAPAWGGFFGSVAAGAAGGAVSGAIMTGSVKGALEGALWGGITGGVAFGVAEAASSLANVSSQAGHGATFLNGGGKVALYKAVGHGLSRSAIQQARYGTMKGAFLSGFVSSGFSVGAGGNPIKGAFQMAIIGGTVSELGGGKFSNGAMSSAFQFLLNDMMYADPLSGDSSGILDPLYGAVEDGWNSLQTGASNFTAGLVSGLKSANSFSTYMGGAMTIAATDNIAAIPGAIFWDITAMGTEGLLLAIGQQNSNASLVNSANGVVIDNISPSGKYGTAAAAALKNITQAE